MATDWIRNRDELAKTITTMSFGELFAVAGALVEMNENGERDINTPLGMAQTLWDWAETTWGDAVEAAKPKPAPEVAIPGKQAP